MSRTDCLQSLSEFDEAKRRLEELCERESPLFTACPMKTPTRDAAAAAGTPVRDVPGAKETDAAIASISGGAIESGCSARVSLDIVSAAAAIAGVDACEPVSAAPGPVPELLPEPVPAPGPVPVQVPVVVPVPQPVPEPEPAPVPVPVPVPELVPVQVRVPELVPVQVPVVVPVQVHVPELVPEPVPAPVPVPEQVPEVVPVPQPVPEPLPAPVPVPEQVPEVVPVPQQVPEVVPVPQPVPEQVPEVVPMPQPVPEPLPVIVVLRESAETQTPVSCRRGDKLLTVPVYDASAFPNVKEFVRQVLQKVGGPALDYVDDLIDKCRELNQKLKDDVERHRESETALILKKNTEYADLKAKFTAYERAVAAEKSAILASAGRIPTYPLGQAQVQSESSRAPSTAGGSRAPVAGGSQAAGGSKAQAAGVSKAPATGGSKAPASGGSRAQAAASGKRRRSSSSSSCSTCSSSSSSEDEDEGRGRAAQSDVRFEYEVCGLPLPRNGRRCLWLAKRGAGNYKRNHLLSFHPGADEDTPPEKRFMTEEAAEKQKAAWNVQKSQKRDKEKRDKDKRRK